MSRLRLLSPKWDTVDDQSLLKLIKELKGRVDCSDENFTPVLQQILAGNWYHRSRKIVSEIENFISEVMVLRPSFAGVAMVGFISKFCPPPVTTCQVDEIPVAWEKVFTICHKNLERIFTSFPMKQESGVKSMGHLYPYMGKSAHIHYCYVHNLIKSMEYLPAFRSQILHLLIHKLIRIDVNIPKQDIQDLSDHQSNSSFRLKSEGEGHEVFTIDLDDEPFEGNPLIQTLDICLNMVIECVDSIFNSSGANSGDEPERNGLFQSLLQIFQTELLPTFGVNNVQFLYFYLLSLNSSFLSSFLEYLWKKGTNINTPAVIRIQTMSYISGILARAQFVSIKTVKRWLTRMSEWANGYATQKSKSCHWSSVNVQAHGPFYAVCQSVFYIFAFRNKELISSRKCLAFTRTLDLGRLVTSELNPLKACEEQISVTFVEAAHQHQISYCRTVLERNQSAIIPTVTREMVSSLAGSEPFPSNQLEAFFPFDPILLPRSKKWAEGIHKHYEPCHEEVKEEKGRRIEDTGEDSIEMELGSYNSLRSTEFYCNGTVPFKVKSESKNEFDLGFID